MTLAIQTYNQSWVKVNHPRNSSKPGLEQNQVADLTADLSDEYFRKTNAIPMSPGMAAAGIEIVGAGALWRCFPGPATMVNLLTTVGETAQVFVSNSKKFEDKHIKDGWLAWFQVLSGVFGFFGVAKETFFAQQEQDYENVPIFEKVTLSGASLLNVFLMLSGSVEKSLLSMVSWNKNENDREKKGSEYRASLTSALSDRRCSGEWAMMTAIPWLSNIGFFKRALDIIIPIQALSEGVDTFVGNPKASFLPEKLANNNGFQTMMKAIADPKSLFTKEVLENEENKDKDKNDKYKLCRPFNHMTRFLLGTENDVGGKGRSGLRNYLLKPMFELLSLGNLRTPLYYLDKDNNIVVEFDEQDLKPKGITKEQQTASSSEPAKDSKLPAPAKLQDVEATSVA